ncbi:MAG: M23 family metallopeptidase [Candidatus Hydrothermales bacterium]
MIFLFLFSQVMTSSFLENRGIRFHLGIDISTYKKIGIPIESPFKGKIIKIVDKWKGYGKAVYIENDLKIIYLYAHLDEFRKDLEEYVYYEKKRIKKNEIDIDLNIEINEKDTIGYSGNTSTVVPHIHLETRKKFSKALNPLFFHDIIDTIKPVIKKIKIYPLGKSLIYSSFLPIEINRPFPETLNITSDFFLWISAYDIQEKNLDKISIYSLRVFLGDSLICELKYDSIDINKNFLARALYTEAQGTFSESFIHPILTDEAFWSGSTFINLENSLSPIKIFVYDFKGNVDSAKIFIKKEIDRHKNIKKKKGIYFVFDGLVIVDTLERKILLKPGQLGKIFDYTYIFPLPEKDYFVKLKNFDLWIPKNFQFFPYPIFLKEIEDTLLVYCAEILFKNPLRVKVKNKKNKEVILKSYGNKNYKFLTSDSIFESYSWGKFFKTVDTFKPVIIGKEIHYINPSGFEIEFIVKDNSSVKNIEFYIDEEWEPVSYNPLTNIARIRVFRKIKKRESNFRLIAEDYSGNNCEMVGKLISKKINLK